jgi:F0F1-type ATP synthase membrane subunit b/b'
MQRRLARMQGANRKHQDIAYPGEDEEAVLVRELEQSLVEARREASAIVREAEQQADEIIAAAKLAQAELERKAAHERKLADQKRRELSTLLLSLLAEVQQTSGAGATIVHSLSEARETRSGRGGAAE